MRITGFLLFILFVGSMTFAANEWQQYGAAKFYSTVKVVPLNSAGIVTNTSGGQLGSVTAVPIANGGTNNASLSTVLGGVVYSDASKLNTLAAGTLGQTLTSGGAGTPVWSNEIQTLGAQSGTAQVFANDTNVVITSSNNTHSLGWASTLSLARGGTQAALSAVAGGVVYTNATNMLVLAAGTANQVLKSNGANAPSWGAPSTYTPPVTEEEIQSASGFGGTNANVLYYANHTIANGGSDITTTFNDSTNGDKFVINTAGTYEAECTIRSSSGSAQDMGITKNSDCLSGGPLTCTAATKIFCLSGSSATAETDGHCSSTRVLQVNDVLRCQTTGGAVSANKTAQRFHIIRIN